jgi:lipoprotein-anchoring transpeptidase ErfK/SrfK
LLTVVALGAMLAFSASAQTGSESKTPSTATPGSESQTPSTGSPGSESETPSTATPGSESQTPSTGLPGSESQTPSIATPGTETQSESPGTPTGSNSAVPEANPASTTIQPRKAAVPDILIVINKPTQRMTVTVNGHVRYRWRVSTGATKYSTPPGSYRAFRMERMHYSREWDNAGMPHSIFFSSRGHAIHGSDHPGLGTPASHGCVRLSLGNAATLFALVSARGVSNTKIVVRGPDPRGYHAATQIPQRRQPARPVGLFGGFFR